MYRITGILFFLLIYASSSLAQGSFRGTPYIKNFSKSDYSAGTQNWDICQDQRGFMYFANNDGLLSFNGVEWNLTRVSSSSPLRSIMIDSNNRLFIGLINDFGIVDNSDDGVETFVSLKNLIPEQNRDFDDIWRIHEIDGSIIFQCYRYIFIYANDTIKVIEPENRFHFSHMVGERFFIQEPGLGLYEMIDSKLTKLAWWDDHLDKVISTILEREDKSLLITTTNDGVYLLDKGVTERWNTAVNSTLVDSRLFSAALLPGGNIAFGTILNGLVLSDSDGNMISVLNNNWGIQNNTVLSTYLDKDNNLWLGLDNGIDYVEINSPITFVGSNKIGTGYCCRVYKGNLYLGTNQGLYYREYDSSSATDEFKLVENTAGQVWALEEFEGQLLCGHNQGTFIVEGGTANLISSEPGAWTFIPVNNNPDILIGGHFEGLLIYKLINGRWTFYKKVEGFSESSRYLLQDNNDNFWIGHSGKGIYRVRLNIDDASLLDVLSFDEKDGLPAGPGSILFKYKDMVCVSTSSGVYTFENISSSFKYSEQINALFENSGRIKTLVDTDLGYSLYIADNESGLITEKEGLGQTKISQPFIRLNDRYVNEFEFIYSHNDESVFLGLEEGFAHYSPGTKYIYNKNYRTFITRVDIPYIDSTLFPRPGGEKKDYIFPFNKNSFRFYFAAPFYENEAPQEFSYYLEDFSEGWSEWSEDTYRDFTRLHEGSYSLHVKARNIYGVEGEPAIFSFEVQPPWRRSTLAYFFYLLIIAFGIFFLVKYILYRINLSIRKEEEKYLEELKEKEERYHREVLLAEKEIAELKAERLKSEMVFRDKELSNQTMAIIDKNKFLKRVNEDLIGVQDFIVADTARKKISALIGRIKREIDIKHHNKIFETYFDEANEEFFRRLKEKHPDLTPYDLRLCAFIKMNISTKEIATILNISYRGAEVSRYRLRKKMELPRDINLSAYLAGI